jgi:hypothetical protein
VLDGDEPLEKQNIVKGGTDRCLKIVRKSGTLTKKGKVGKVQ